MAKRNRLSYNYFNENLKNTAQISALILLHATDVWMTVKQQEDN